MTSLPPELAAFSTLLDKHLCRTTSAPSRHGAGNLPHCGMRLHTAWPEGPVIICFGTNDRQVVPFSTSMWVPFRLTKTQCGRWSFWPYLTSCYYPLCRFVAE